MKTLKHLSKFLMLLLIIGSGCEVIEEPPANDSVVTAEAGDNQTVNILQEVTLDGTASFDSKGFLLTYSWSFKSVPDGSGVRIINSTDSITTFTPDVEGIYEIELTVSNGTTSDTDEVSISARPLINPIVISGSIEEETTLSPQGIEGGDYIVQGTVFVNAGLIIEPGTVVLFEEDAGFDVSEGGWINALGESSQPITLKGEEEETGYWSGLNFTSRTLNNLLKYVEIHHAGSRGFDGADLKSAVMVENNALLKIEKTTITKSGGYALYIRDNESDVTFLENTFTENVAPIACSIFHFHMFDHESDLTGNTLDAIESWWANEATAEDVTWKNLTVPYLLYGNIERIQSKITVQEGTVVMAKSEAGIRILADGGGLKAEGADGNTVTFRGMEELSGYWKGLSFESNTSDNQLLYTHVLHTGSDGFDGANILAGVILEDNAQVSIQNSTVSQSAGFGVYVRSFEAQLVNFEDNIITQNNVPVSMFPQHYSNLNSNNDFTGNTNDYIDTNSQIALTGTHTWQAINVPFRIRANFDININGAVTVEAGVHLKGGQDSGIEIFSGLDGNTGSFNATGENTTPIILEGDEDVVGYWKGIRFDTNSANNKLDFVQISHGGSEGFDGGNRKANIEVSDNGSATVENCTITKSGGNGIRVQGGGLLTESGNSFSDITGTNIVID